MAGALILVLAVVLAKFNLFSILILEGKVFYLALIGILLSQLNYKWIIGLGVVCWLAALVMFLTTRVDNADLLSTIGFKVMIIASASVLISQLFQKPTKD